MVSFYKLKLLPQFLMEKSKIGNLRGKGSWVGRGQRNWGGDGAG